MGGHWKSFEANLLEYCTGIKANYLVMIDEILPTNYDDKMNICERMAEVAAYQLQIWVHRNLLITAEQKEAVKKHMRRSGMTAQLTKIFAKKRITQFKLILKKIQSGP